MFSENFSLEKELDLQVRVRKGPKDEDDRSWEISIADAMPTASSGSLKLLSVMSKRGCWLLASSEAILPQSTHGTQEATIIHLSCSTKYVAVPMTD